ncbi:MAG: GGDEF domain-containing protein [Clostridia bacterium]|nr:GGDEF domain-containing protein [Clostridia bacterium]
MKNIAVIATAITYSHIQKNFVGIQRCCAEYGCNVFAFVCERRFEAENLHDIGEYEVYKLPDFSQFDGAIVVCSTIFDTVTLDDIFRRIRAAGIPAAALERQLPGLYGVCIDNKSAMKDIVLHLIDHHGFKRINFITGLTGNNEAADRYAAYKEALRERNIPFDARRVFTGDYLKKSGEDAAEAFLQSDLPFPEAIVASNDHMAMGAYSALTRRGIRVPEDVAITGFDNDFEAMYHIPGVTSVERMQEKQGYLACRAVLDGTVARESGHVLHIQTQSVFRESCGCKSSDEISDVEFRRLHFSLADMNDRFTTETRSMAIELTAVDSFERLKDVIKMFLPNIACDLFNLYLFDSVLESTPLDLERADMLHLMHTPAYVRGNCTLLIGYDNGVFTEDLPCDLYAFIDAAKAKENGGGYFILSPIHFRNTLFGYCIIGNSTFPLESEQYYTWVMNIGNAVETVIKQRLMKQMIRKLDSMWCYDGLTNVYNRMGFKKYGSRVWDESIKKRCGAMLLFVDMDGLKRINDEFGHDEGDRCIRELASILMRVRKHGEAVMRYGGDEFVFIASGVDQAYADQCVQSIKQSMEAFNAASDLPYKLSASIGLHILFPQPNDLLDDAIDAADQKMYAEKKEKRERQARHP